MLRICTARLGTDHSCKVDEIAPAVYEEKTGQVL
jgi:hypothetical protein